MRWLLWCFCLLAESYETINHYHSVHKIFYDQHANTVNQIEIRVQIFFNVMGYGKQHHVVGDTVITKSKQNIP